MTLLRAMRLALSLAALASIGLLAWIIVDGPRSVQGTVLPVGSTQATIGLSIDLLAAVLLVLVAGVGAVSGAFAARNLVGGPRLARYAALHTATVAGLALAVTAASLPLLVVGWTLAGLALAGLVSHSGTDEVRRVATHVRRRLLVGDGLLALGVVVVGTTLSSLDRLDLAGAVAAADSLPLVAGTVLMVLGASIRSALVPWHRWLPETAEGPTSTSALLHAGLVNGVGLLGVLAWPLMAASWPALVLLVLLGTTSAVVATLLGRIRPDVKGRLATSTSAQMGYLALQIGLAVPAAALFHLIGHALYKATLFLGAGSTVAQSRLGAQSLPSRAVTTASVVLAGAVTVAIALPLLAAWPDADKGISMALPLTLASAVAGIALARLVADAGTSAAGRVLGGTVVMGLLACFVVAVLAWVNAFAPTFAAPVSLDAASTTLLVAAVVLAGLVGLAIDVAVRSGRMRWVAVRAALQSAPLVRPLRRRVGSVVIAEFPEPSQADVARTRALMDVAADAVGPTWPLTGYVAANPVAGLERLSYVDALAHASALWGDGRAIDSDAFRRYYAAGRITDADLDATIGERDDRDEIRALLLAGADAGAHLGSTAARVVADLGVQAPAAEPAQQSWHGSTAVDALDQLLDAHVTAWVDAHAAVWSAVVHGPESPWLHNSTTLYEIWRTSMATGAADGPLGVRGAGRLVAGLPERSDAAVAMLLDRLDVPHAQRIGYLSRTLARAPGWAAHQAWRASLDSRHDMADVLAVRLGLEFVLVEAVTSASFGRPARWQELVTMLDERHDWDPSGAAVLDAGRREDIASLLAWAAGALGWDDRRLAGAGADEVTRLLATATSMPPHVRLEMWQSALERSFRHTLLDSLRPRSAGLAPARPATPRAQVITCIDVRSERYRRHLEEVDDIETLGFAGFFGVPFSLVDSDGVVSDQCPVLISPGNTVRSEASATPAGATAARSAGRAFRAAQKEPLLPLVLAEATGWLMAVAAAMRTFAPRAAKSLEKRGTTLPPEVLAFAADGEIGFDHSEKVYLGEASLRAMGLVDSFAPVVLLLGHSGATTNNPYAAGYDCGACGGNGGLVNARVAAGVLNDPDVRRDLRGRGIDIPDATVFVAGLHDTTRDVVTLIPESAMPAGHDRLLAELMDELDRAARDTTAERLPRLPDVPAGADVRRHAERRAADWAETRPEWGLAGNAALLVGPRELSRDLDLDGRVFLHSYRPEADPDGAALEVILTAPLVVGQWINSGYLFATLDPERFGAGDKVLHNPIGGIGVLRGAHGDLRLGLPFQGVSAGSADPSGLPVHEPMRLAAVVAADRDVVAAIVDRQPSVRRLLTGRWISLYVLDAGTSDAWQWTSDGWHRVSTPDIGSPSRIKEEVAP